MVRRTKVDVAYDVLSLLKQGACKQTEIQYSCNMSYAMLLRWLKKLRENGLIVSAVSTKGTIVYIISGAGKRALHQLSPAKAICDKL